MALLALLAKTAAIPLRLLLLHLDCPNHYHFERFAPDAVERVANTVKWGLEIRVRLKIVDGAVLRQVVIKVLDR